MPDDGDRLTLSEIRARYLERDRPLPRGIGGAKILKRELRTEKPDPRSGCWDRRTRAWID